MDRNLELKERTLMTVNTCFKNMETPVLPQFPLPGAFKFKEGGVLTTHPLRNHPQRLFG